MNPASHKIPMKIKKIIFAFLFLFTSSITKAQVILSENFDQPNPTVPVSWPASNLPFGWTQSRGAGSTSNDNYWDRMNNPGSNPTCSPFGTAMVRYRSFYVTPAGESGYLVSKPFDLGARPAGLSSNVRFRIYRENTPGTDNIQVYANDNPDLTGTPALLQDTATGFFNVPRPCSIAPADPCGAWTMHGFQIPANSWSVSNLYIIIKVTDAGTTGANVYIDDFSITTYPSPQSFNTISLDFQNTLNVAKNTVNNSIIGARIHVYGGIPMSLGTFIFTHNGTDNPATDITGAGTGGSVKLWWTGGESTFNENTAVLAGTYAGAAFPQPTFSITPAGITLENGNNYFWLTYNCSAGAVSNNHLDADFISAVVGGVTRTCGTIGCTLPGSRLIDVAYCIPSYTIGTSGNNYSYINNDYIKRVDCSGDPAYPPGIHNGQNDHGPIGGAGSSDPCVPPGGCTGGPCPFGSHPWDYEQFSAASVPSSCGAGNHSRTATFLSTSVSPPLYPFSVQCGTWYGSNYIAAFIDFNHDGVFNNIMWNLPNGEKIFQSTAMAALTTQNGNFQVPQVGIGLPYYGNTTLRVREVYAQSNIDACSQAYYGETEDYVVTIKAPCNPPGWKIWLGYTDDWNTAANWCGGLPTINDDALIPGTGGPNYYHPVIKSGVTATARKLIIKNDTVQINAPIAGSLTIADSLLIDTNSLLKVDSAFSDTAALGNGVNTNTTYCPLRASFKEQKMQLMYKTSELLAMGMQDGDIIGELCIPLRVRASVQPYMNFNINMYYATNNATYPNFVNLGFSSPPPAAANNLAPQATVPVNVFSAASVLMTSQVPGASGTYKFVLQTPFTFSTASNYPLIVEICYDFGTTSTNDQVWQTQTVGYRSVLLLADPASTVPGGCNIVNNGTLAQKLSSDLRPNLCFEFHKDYDKYPINVKGHWKNNSNFIAGNSIVTFNGTALQHIRGVNTTSFYDLTINNSSGVKIFKSPSVAGVLDLKLGKLDLNGNAISILNPGINGIVRTSGSILSETASPNYGTVEWAIGTSTGSHVFPFRTSGNIYIPLTYNLISGNVGTVKAATYPTPANNLPYPAGVTNVNDTNNVNNSAFTVDRFWHIKKTGPSGTARIKFTYLNTEAYAPIVNGNIRAQRYDFSVNKWKILTNTMVNTINTPSASTSEVHVYGLSGSNLGAAEWALADASSPLRMDNPVPFEVAIAPNPFTDKINISIDLNPDDGENISLTLFNLLGERINQIIIPADLLSDNERFEWSPGKIENGIYFLIIQTKDKVRTEQVIKMGE